MNNASPSDIPERNLETQHNHRREVFWQIVAPIIISGLILFLIAILISTGRSGNVGAWAHTSLIWLSLPLLVFFLIIIIITSGLVYVCLQLILVIPSFANKLQNTITQVGAKINKLSDAVVEPILRFQSILAAIRILLQKLTPPPSDR